MGENTTGVAERIEPDCEATFIMREAENLEEITLACYDIDIDDTDEDTDTANKENDISDTTGMDFYVAQIQKAAWAVMEEARRLESEVEHYVDQLLIRLAGRSAESSPTPQDRLSAGNNSEIAREALAVTREAEQLQELVLRLFARIVLSTEEDSNNND